MICQIILLRVVKCLIVGCCHSMVKFRNQNRIDAIVVYPILAALIQKGEYFARLIVGRYVATGRV